MPGGTSFQARYIDCADISDAIAITHAGVRCQGEGGGSCAGVNGDGPQLAIGAGVAGEIALAHKNAASAIAAAREYKGGASPSQPTAAAIDGVLPSGTSFQSRYIDCANIGDAIAIAAAGVRCQGEGGGSCAGVNGDGPQLAIGAGVAGEIALAHKNAASAIAATSQLKGGASSRQPTSTAIGGVLPGCASFQARYIDGADIADAIASAHAAVRGQGEGGSSWGAGVDHQDAGWINEEAGETISSGITKESAVGVESGDS